MRETLRDGAYAMPVPVDDDRAAIAEENVAQQPRDGACAGRAGVRRALDEVPDMHNYVGWRDAFDPHLTALLRRRGAMNATSTSCTRRRSARAARSWPTGTTAGPVLAFPAEGGSAWDWRATTAWSARSAACSRPAGSSSTASTPSTPRRGRTSRSRSRSARASTAATSRGSSTRSCRSSTTTAAARRDRHHRRQPRRLPRRQLRAQARRPVPARDLPVGQLRPGDLERLGRARRRGLLQQPARLRRAPRRRPPRLAARAAEPPAGLRAGHVGGHDRRAGEHQAPRRAARARRASATSSTCGATTSRTTGRRGAPRSPIICPRFC